VIPKITDFNYSSIVKYLTDLLCKNLTQVRLSQSHDYIDISFLNNFKISIYASRSLTTKNQYFSSQNSLVFFDEKFSLLKNLITNQPIRLEYTNELKELLNILKAFSNENVDKKIKNKQYWKLIRFELKELLSAHFKLGLDPKKEYFLFGNNQIRARYYENFMSPSIRTNQKIKIIDDSAILIEKNQKRIIDIDHEILIKTELKLTYKNVDQMVFNLSKNTASEFVLSDNFGEIEIHHPDLLFYFLS